MSIYLAVFLRVAAVILAIGIFNMIRVKQACDIVFGKRPITFRGLRLLAKDVFTTPLPKFLLDWWVGLFNFDLMVRATAEKGRQMARARARAKARS